MTNANKVRLNALTLKYLLGTLSKEESLELDALLDQDPLHRVRFMERVDPTVVRERLGQYLEAEERRTDQTAPGKGRVRRLRYLLIPYAAALVLVAAGIILWIMQQKPRAPVASSKTIPRDFQPGGNKAILTLADGSSIDLDSAGKGAISNQGGSRVFKAASGRIVYKDIGHSSATTAYNTVTTPRGGTFLVELPDGSKAWLNTASRIRFPVSFTAATREVEMSGEVYFEVASNPSKPFRVRSASVAVQVLGTAFAVQNYSNEPAAMVTLLQGSVKVSADEQDHILRPGQQASLSSGRSADIIDDADTEGAIAWKTGFFKFQNADIRSLMREIERWYDVEVSYQITDDPAAYGGRISRNLTLSELLRLLEGNHIHHYKMEGRKLIVLP